MAFRVRMASRLARNFSLGPPSPRWSSVMRKFSPRGFASWAGRTAGSWGGVSGRGEEGGGAFSVSGGGLTFNAGRDGGSGFSSGVTGVRGGAASTAGAGFCFLSPSLMARSIWRRTSSEQSWTAQPRTVAASLESNSRTGEKSSSVKHPLVGRPQRTMSKYAVLTVRARVKRMPTFNSSSSSSRLPPRERMILCRWSCQQVSASWTEMRISCSARPAHGGTAKTSDNRSATASRSWSLYFHWQTGTESEVVPVSLTSNT